MPGKKTPTPASFTPQGFVTDVWQQFLIDEFQDETGIKVPTSPSPGGMVGSAAHDMMKAAFPDRFGVPNQTFQQAVRMFTPTRQSNADILWTRSMQEMRRRMAQRHDQRPRAFQMDYTEQFARHFNVLADAMPQPAMRETAPPPSAREAPSFGGRVAMPDFDGDDPDSNGDRQLLAMALICAFLCFLCIHHFAEIVFGPASARNARAYRMVFGNFHRDVVTTVPTLPADQVRRLMAEFRQRMNLTAVAL